MLLGALMAERGAPDPLYSGILTNDDNVLAINISSDPDAAIDTYAVVQGAIVGVDAQLNPQTQDKTYIRAGQSSAKTGTQRTFKATGDRYIGDDFQDFVMDRARLYGVGQAVVTQYVWFCLLNGKGEKGECMISVNSDGSGNAGETAGIDVDLKKSGPMPDDYTYVPEGTLGALTVTSVAGSTTGKTAVTVSPSPTSGLSAVYKTGATVAPPNYDDPVTGWTTFVPGTEYTATAGNDFTVAYIDVSNKAKYAGSTKAVVA